MTLRDRKASSIDAQADLTALTPEEAREFLAAALTPDPRSGVLQLYGQPCVIVRPEVIVNIQKQLELTIGGSAKGIMYLAGERSSQEGVSPFRALSGEDVGALTLEMAKRMIDASSLLGWGHAEIGTVDPEKGRFVLRIANSPMAIAYGPSKKPVCHFLAGWAAGMAQVLVGGALLCEEVACKAQGREFCEFELRPMPAP